MPVKFQVAANTNFRTIVVSEPRRVSQRNQQSGPRLSTTARRQGENRRCHACAQSAQEHTGFCEATHHEVRHHALPWKRRREMQKNRNPTGAGRWVCLTQPPPPATGCVTVKFHSVCAPRLFEAAVARTHTLLFLARWVARSSVGSRVARRLPGRHPLVAARPLRCWPTLSVVRRGSGRPPHWWPQGGLLPAGTCWTRPLSSMRGG